MVFELEAERLGADDRETPSVERDAFGKDLGAVPVSAASNRVPANLPAYCHAVPPGADGRMLDASWATGQARFARWSARSRSKTFIALSSRLSSPSGWLHAPRWATWPAHRTILSRSESSALP